MASLKTTDYVILTAGSSESLHTKVLEHLKQGWDPLGGGSHSPYDHEHYYAQAMVKTKLVG